MGPILEFIDSWSFRKILSVMVLFTGLLLIPFLWWANSQKVTYKSRANLEPTTYPTPILYGTVPVEEPLITKIIPFYGKVGDEMVIEGKNLGQNPTNSAIYLDNQPVQEIVLWSGSEIILVIPEGAVSSELRLQIDHWQVNWPQPMSIYDASTQIEVELTQNHVSINQAQGIKRVVIWDEGQASAKTYQFPQPLAIDSWLSPDSFIKVNWVTLYDDSGQIMPFWIDPLKNQFN